MVEVVILVRVGAPGTVGAVASTVTVVVAVLVPLLFVAVIVYVMVEVGFTVVDPMRVEVENPPGVIVTLEAFVMFQESVEVPAEATTAGDALNELIVGLMPETVIPEASVEDAEMLPTLSCAVTAYQ